MKKIILILLLLLPLWAAPLWGGGCFAQGDFTRIYHPIINEAELAIVDTSYYEALDFYKEAFANVKKPFAKDYYNAAICAAMVGKMPTVFDYLEKIIEKGYPSDSLRKDVFFHYVADTCKNWKKFEQQMKLVKPNINQEVRDSLNILYTLSTKILYTPLTSELREFIQKYKSLTEFKTKVNGRDTTFQMRIATTDSLYYFEKLPENLKLQQDSLRKINDIKYSEALTLTSKKLSQLIDFYGFPDENLIGLSSFDYSILNPINGRFAIASRNYNDLIFNKSIAINLLSSSSLNNSKDFLSIFIQAIRDGKIHPNQVANINFTNFNPITKTVIETLPIAYTMGKVQVLQFRLDENIKCENPLLQGKGDKKFWKKEQFNTYSEAEINEKRTDIGLEKVADAYKKAFFKSYNTPFIINGGNYQSELSYVSSCEVLEKMLKESVLLR